MTSSSVTDTFAEQLLELAKRAGVEEAEVFQSRSQSCPVSFEANRLKQLDRTQADGTAIRLWKSGKPGLAVAYGEVEAQVLVDRALALSELNDVETIELTSGKARAFPDAGLPATAEQLIEWGNQAMAQVRDRYPEVLCGGGFDCEVEETRILNTRGLDYRYQDTTLSGYLEASLVKGDDFLAIYDGQASLSGQLSIDQLAQAVLQRLDWAQSNAEPPNGRVPVLLTAKAADLLWSTLQSALNGKQVLEGASPWSQRKGDRVLAQNLSFYQDPSDGPYACPFDDEGMITQRMDFLRGGVLEQFYCDRATGKIMGQGSTGNGFRNLGSPPIPGLFNFIVAGGERSFDELVAAIDEGLLLDQVLGGGPGISGDFSVNVDLGYRIQGGKIIGRIKDTMVAGNVYQCLQDSVTLGNDGEWNGSCWTPSVTVEGLSVVGKD